MRRAPLTQGAVTFTLAPVRDVAIRDDGFEALGREPWLRITPDDAFRRGRIVEMRYAAGLLDRVTRPILRFVLSDGQVRDALMPAATEGIAIWRGRVPGETVEVRISPTARAGPFSFALLSVQPLPVSTLLRFAAKSPKRAFFVAGARVARLQAEADLNLRWMLGQAETQDFRAWSAARGDAGLKLVPADDGHSFAIVVHAHDASVDDVATTLESLRPQANWRLILSDPSARIDEWAKSLRDPRVSACKRLFASEPEADFTGFLRAGDAIAPHGLASFATHFAQQPWCDLIYADELHANGQAVFKPDWSPVWQRFAPYVGRATMVRTSFFRATSADGGLSLRDGPDATVARILAVAENGRVGHLRRVLLTLRHHAEVTPSTGDDCERPLPAIGIVIPTRDRLDLLRPCIESVLRETDYPDFRIVIADNGSAEAETVRWLAEIARDPRVTVAAMPGPFNFADICNRAARLFDSELLLFLNNDTAVLDPHWLRNLAEFAMRPDIGAVGAKLLHADGRVQHAGVVLGLGGVAGHFGAGLRDEEPGWLGGNRAPHEVSAVTGACLMVEARKFWAVGGFDAEHLPIELNDIDLCLRLGERGWRTVCDCRTRLLHHESASRGGATFRLQRVYAAERRYFIERWGHLIRDDPCFSPALSLFARHPALW